MYVQPLGNQKNECVHCERILVGVYRGKRLLRVSLLVVLWRRCERRWLPLICGVRSGRKFLFLPILKAEAGLSEEAAVGEDAEDIEHPQENADATADHERESAAFPRRESEEGFVEASDEGLWAVTVDPHAVTASEFRNGVRV